MITQFICLVILNTLLGLSWAHDTKAVSLIVGGKNAPRGRYPWQILLFRVKRNSRSFLCGGTILNRDYALTAAHCLYRDDMELVVAVGKHEMGEDESYTQYSNVRYFTKHENYDTRTDENDIAVLKLATRLQYVDDYVQPVNLAAEGDQPPARGCFASGFGVVNERTNAIADTLQELRTKVVNKRKCTRFARKYEADDLITDDVVCTKDKKKGVCSGDSGGPLGCFDAETGNYTQYGVLSWGSTKCVKGFNVYTRVSQYRDWIADNTRD